MCVFACDALFSFVCTAMQHKARLQKNTVIKFHVGGKKGDADFFVLPVHHGHFQHARGLAYQRLLQLCSEIPLGTAANKLLQKPADTW